MELTLNMSSSVSINKKALIVDDETDICFLLSSILKQKDIQSFCAGSLAEAERKLENHPDVSFIFLDNHLPDGWGVKCISGLKKRFPHSFIVMITAHDNSADRLLAVNNGVDYFVAKPFSTDLIMRTIDKLIA